MTELEKLKAAVDDAVDDAVEASAPAVAAAAEAAAEAAVAAVARAAYDPQRDYIKALEDENTKLKEKNDADN